MMSSLGMIFVLKARVLLKVEKLCLLLRLRLFLAHANVGKHSLGDASMAIALRHAFLFERVRNLDGLPAEILAIHLRNGRVSRLKIIKRNEAILLAAIRFRVAHDLSRNHNAKLSEHLLELFLIDAASEISNKNVGSHFLRPLILTRLVDLNRLSK
jgi:hypothetical protein